MKSYIQYFLLTFFLFLFWMALTVSLSLANILLGAACSFFVSFFTMKLLGNKLDKTFTVSVLIRFPVFAFGLIWEIIKANIELEDSKNA